MYTYLSINLTADCGLAHCGPVLNTCHLVCDSCSRAIYCRDTRSRFFFLCSTPYCFSFDIVIPCCSRAFVIYTVGPLGYSGEFTVLFLLAVSLYLQTTVELNILYTPHFVWCCDRFFDCGCYYLIAICTHFSFHSVLVFFDSCWVVCSYSTMLLFLNGKACYFWLQTVFDCWIDCEYFIDSCDCSIMCSTVEFYRDRFVLISRHINVNFTINRLCDLGNKNCFVTPTLSSRTA